MEIRDLEDCYNAYEEAVRQAVRKAGPADGLLGMKSSVESDPCHEAFYGRVGELTAELAESLRLQPDPDTAAKAVRFLLEAKLNYPEKHMVWMCMAAEKHALPLIPLLSRDAAGDLLALYDRISPAGTRFPAQREVAKALKSRRS